MSKIISELEPIREVSLANDSILLKKFLRAKDTESVALDAAAAVDLSNFRHIERLANYTVLDFNPSAPLGIGNSITGAYAGLMLITLILTFGCCCACKCCRSCCSDMLFLVYRLVRWLLMSSFQAASWLYRKCQFWYASKKASEERSGAEESCPLEYTKEAEEHNVVFTSPIDSGVGDCTTVKSKLSRLINRPRATSLSLSTGRVGQGGHSTAGRTSTPKQTSGGGNDIVYADVSFIPIPTEEPSPVVRRYSEDNIPRDLPGEGSVSEEQLADGWRLDRSGCSRLLLVKDRSCEELTWNDYKSAVFNSLGTIWEDGKYIDTSSPDKRQACGFKDDLYLCRRSLDEVDRIGLA
jgi:hypothetical protein